MSEQISTETINTDSVVMTESIPQSPTREGGDDRGAPTPHPPSSAGLQDCDPSPSPSTPPRTRAEINRDNAQKSTGPRTAAGKAISRLNGFRHGLCAQSMILPPEDHDALITFSRSLADTLCPDGHVEHLLVQSMADSHFQLERSRAIENNILQLGALENCAPDDPARNFHMDHTEGMALALKANIKTLDLLSRYGTRHHRQFLQSHARLREIQHERIKAGYARINEDKKRHNPAFRNHQQAAASGQKTTTNQSSTEDPGFAPQSKSSSTSDQNPAREGGDLTPKTTQEIAANYLKNGGKQAA